MSNMFILEINRRGFDVLGVVNNCYYFNERINWEGGVQEAPKVAYSIINCKNDYPSKVSLGHHHLLDGCTL